MEALGYPAGEPEVLLGQLVKLVRGGERCGCRGAPATSSRSPTSSTRSIPTSRGSRSCCRASTPRRRSTSTSSPRSRWRTPSTTCSTRTPASRRSAAGRRRAGVGAGPDRSTSNLAPLDARARARAPAVRSRSIPTSSPRRPSCGRRSGSPRGCATSPRAFHGFYRDCRVITDDAALTQARLWLAEACRIGLANALAILGVARPRRDGTRRRRQR